MGPFRAKLFAWTVLALIAGHDIQQASAAVSLKMPVIPFLNPLRGGYVDLITRQPVTTSFTAAESGPAPVGDPSAFQQQNNLWHPAPKPTSRLPFPVTLPSPDYLKQCVKDSDSLSALVTKCNYQDTFQSCDQLATLGYLPKGVQSFEAPKLTGAFNLPTGCATGTLGVSYDKLFRLTFNSPQVPILAVITKDPVGSLVSYFGTGSTQGRIKHRLATKAEFCYAPTLSQISVSKTAIYSTGMQPGTASWTFSASAELPPPYKGNRAVMFTGDSVDTTWTLSASKSGTDVNYQGVVSGTISINNPTPAAITVNSIVDQITGGPVATVACPVGTPFTVPQCAFATCQFTAYYPTAPPPGTYSAAAQVQFQVVGSQGFPASVQGSTAFSVGGVGSLSALATDMGSIPSGSALVTASLSPAGHYMFSGAGTQTFQTPMTCTADSATGALTSTATLTGSNGQQIQQSATVQKQCYDLGVSIAVLAPPKVGRWGWTVTKTASPTTLNLKPDVAASKGPSLFNLGRDSATSSTTGDVVYTVTYTRNPPAGFVGGEPAFEASGEVYVNNPAPINAQLQGVYISIANTRGGQPYVTQATCPVLLVPAGQKITCTWQATPTFNPVGQQVRGTARYTNLINGEPKGSTTDFNSPPVVISDSSSQDGGDGGDGSSSDDGSAPKESTFKSRNLQQTWGAGPVHATKAVPVKLTPDVQPAVATTLYAVDGTPIVVPGSLANGTGVIVSGNSIVSGGIPAVAMSASRGVPVMLSAGLTGASGPMYVNEAGPAGSGRAMVQLSGLQDECADVADAFMADNGTVQGKLISGTQPSGRICTTTTFTYTMRYGPFSDCITRKSANAATYQTVDTQTSDTAEADVTIKVDGCVNPSALKITPARVMTSAQGGYTWSVRQLADKEDLVLGQDATATVTHTVDVKRVGNNAGATMAADVAVTNPTAYPIPIEAATYTATTVCDGNKVKTTTGPVECDGAIVTPKGQLSCKISANVPCAGNGAYTVVLTAGGGFTITSVPTPFMFNTTQLTAANVGTQCTNVRELFEAGTGKLGGVVVSGAKPSGQLCASKTFTYSVKYGPFTKCGSFKAVKTATLSSDSAAHNATSSFTLPISVVGCSLYTDMARAADCVRFPPYWSKCNVDTDVKCAGGWKLLPGGKAKATLFFPQPNERSTRTYSTMLQRTVNSTTPASKAAYTEAGKQYITAQLNFLSGARLPTVELQEAYDSLSSFLSTTSETTSLSQPKIKAIQVQAALLGKYNNGTLPASFGAPPKCK